MAAIHLLHALVQNGGAGFPLAEPDDRGLSRTALANDTVLYVLASPQPEESAADRLDSLFMYAPLVSLRGLAEVAFKPLFYRVGALNLPAGMAPGVKLGVESSSELIWIGRRMAGGSLTSELLAEAVRHFVAEALHWKPYLIDLVTALDVAEGAAGIQTPAKEQTAAAQRNPTEAQNETLSLQMGLFMRA